MLATAISWTVLSADFNRFASRARAGVIGSGVGYTLSTVISMSLGATAIGYVVLSGGEAIPFDPVTIIEPFGALLAVAIFLSVMATNTMVVYGMVTTVVNALPGRRLKFLPTALVLGRHLDHRLDVLRAARPVHDVPGDDQRAVRPVFAIMIVDYYIVKRGAYTPDILQRRDGRYWYIAGVNWRAVVAWVDRRGRSPTSGRTSGRPPFGATIPAFVVTFVLYLLLSLARAFVDSRRAKSAHLAGCHDGARPACVT